MSESTSIHPKEISCADCAELLVEFLKDERALPYKDAAAGLLPRLKKEDKKTVEDLIATGLSDAEKTLVAALLSDEPESGLDHIVAEWKGVEPTEAWRRSTIERFITESQMMQSKPFRDAADKDRAERDAQKEKDEEESGLPIALVLGASLFLAVAAYIIVSALRG